MLLSKFYPGTLCGSNDTIFASWGPLCSEKTPPDENHHLPKFHLVYTNTTFSIINIQMSPGDALRFQWHHFRLMGTRLLREDPSRRKPPFFQIIFNLDKHNIFKFDYQMSPGDALRFHWHHFRLMGTRLVREDPSRRKPPFVQIQFGIQTRNIFKY